MNKTLVIYCINVATYIYRCTALKNRILSRKALQIHNIYTNLIALNVKPNSIRLLYTKPNAIRILYVNTPPQGGAWRSTTPNLRI